MNGREDEVNVPDYLWSLERIDEVFAAAEAVDEIAVADYLWSNEVLLMQAAALTSAIGRSLAIGRRVSLSFRGIQSVRHPFLCTVFESLHNRFNAMWIWSHIGLRDADDTVLSLTDRLRNDMMSGSSYRQAV